MPRTYSQCLVRLLEPMKSYHAHMFHAIVFRAVASPSLGRAKAPSTLHAALKISGALYREALSQWCGGVRVRSTPTYRQEEVGLGSALFGSFTHIVTWSCQRLGIFLSDWNAAPGRSCHTPNA